MRVNNQFNISRFYIVGNRVDSQDSCSARPRSTKKSWYLSNYFIYIFIFFIYLISGAAVNVTSTGLFLATHNSYLIKSNIISNYNEQ